MTFSSCETLLLLELFQNVLILLFTFEAEKVLVLFLFVNLVQ